MFIKAVRTDSPGEGASHSPGEVASHSPGEGANPGKKVPEALPPTHPFIPNHHPGVHPPGEGTEEVTDFLVSVGNCAGSTGRAGQAARAGSQAGSQAGQAGKKGQAGQAGRCM